MTGPAHRLCKEYNDTFEDEMERRKEIMDALMPERGKNVYFQGPIYFDFGTNTYFGNNSYANFNLTVLDICPVTIGDNVFIGPNASFLTPLHPLRYQDRNPYFDQALGHITEKEYGAPITVGDN